MIKTIVPCQALEVKQFVSENLAEDLHKKRQSSLADGVLGVLTNQSLKPAEIGRGLAQAKGLLPKHAIKQVNRLLANDAINSSEQQSHLARLLIGHRKRIVVAMDWTVFAKDSQMTITLRLITKHGRATPLLWKTVSSIGLKGHKNGHVFFLLEKLKRLVGDSTQVIVLADREFGTLNNMKNLKDELGLDYILRIKRNFTISDCRKIKKQLAHEWLNRNEAVCVDDAFITVQEYQVNKVVICQEADMKDMWVLACSLKNIATQTILTYYGKRWGTETSYRDEKDLNFGLGMKKARIKNSQRRDRLFLLSAIAIIFLTLIGAASEIIGFDKYIKANTSPKRTHSLFTQGLILLKLMPKLAEQWNTALVQAIEHLVGGMNYISDEQYVV